MEIENTATTAPKFDAFQGNPLQKSTTKKASISRRQINGSRVSMMKSTEQLYNFDQMWRGSISNLKSSENITEDLIAESIRELENAMGESKRMLVERDNEIARLREFIENNKLASSHNEDDDKRHAELVKELRETQKQNASLERQIHELKLEHSRELSQLKDEYKEPAIWHLEEPAKNRPECTCYCGTVCKALKDLMDTRQTLEVTKSKYDNLKKRVREFKRQAELEQQNKNMRSLVREDDRMSNCTIQ